jgi:hypothetical protein
MSQQLVDARRDDMLCAKYRLAAAAEDFVEGKLTLNDLRERCEAHRFARTVFIAASNAIAEVLI